MTAPQWMLVTAEQYDSWSPVQCAGIEMVDGVIVLTPRPSIRHNRIARLIAGALDDAGGTEWNADTDFDLRLQDVPLINLRPDVVVYRAVAIDITPARPQNVLLVVEVVSPGSETTDRQTKMSQYAKAGIAFYWRVEQSAANVPIIYTYVLDPAASAYRDSDVHTGRLTMTTPFEVDLDLRAI